MAIAWAAAIWAAAGPRASHDVTGMTCAPASAPAPLGATPPIVRDVFEWGRGLGTGNLAFSKGRGKVGDFGEDSKDAAL